MSDYMAFPTINAQQGEQLLNNRMIGSLSLTLFAILQSK